jgi:hypothetical protein
MSSHQLLLLTGQACELEMNFSLGETVSSSLLLVSPKKCSTWLSPQGLLSCPTPTWAFSSSVFSPSPRQREIFPLCFGPPVLSKRGAIGSPAVLEYVDLSQTVCCTHLADSLGWKWIYRAAQAGGTQRFYICLCLAGPSLPRCLQKLSFWSSLCCVIVGKVADTLGGSWRFCDHMYYDWSRYSQMLTVLCCSLHCVLALLTQVGGN